MIPNGHGAEHKIAVSSMLESKLPTNLFPISLRSAPTFWHYPPTKNGRSDKRSLISIESNSYEGADVGDLIDSVVSTTRLDILYGIATNCKRVDVSLRSTTPLIAVLNRICQYMIGGFTIIAHTSLADESAIVDLIGSGIKIEFWEECNVDQLTVCMNDRIGIELLVYELLDIDMAKSPHDFYSHTIFFRTRFTPSILPQYSDNTWRDCYIVIDLDK